MIERRANHFFITKKNTSKSAEILFWTRSSLSPRLREQNAFGFFDVRCTYLGVCSEKLLCIHLTHNGGKICCLFLSPSLSVFIDYSAICGRSKYFQQFKRCTQCLTVFYIVVDVFQPYGPANFSHCFAAASARLTCMFSIELVQFSFADCNSHCVWGGFKRCHLFALFCFEILFYLYFICFGTWLITNRSGRCWDATDRAFSIAIVRSKRFFSSLALHIERHIVLGPFSAKSIKFPSTSKLCEK